MNIVALLSVSIGMWAQSPVEYQRDIRPVISKRCFACHGPDEKGRMANFRIDQPGSSGMAKVIARVTDDKRPMPPVGPRLNSSEIENLKKWIAAGAPYTSHWAFEKPNADPGVGNGIDHYVRARLAKEGMQPSPEADRFTLARRVALDLTGLPPVKEVLDAFLKDTSAGAYERMVDKVLASPAYGERWAKVWLDLARYADTQGYEKDNNRTIWPYRDWVIRAFQTNMPFDQFTVEQIAGDLLPGATDSQRVATGFHRNTMTNTEGGTDDEEFRDAAVKDRIAVSGQVWMGLTVGCAQCHSHKYDPISHQEFYQLYAFLNQTEDSDKPTDAPVLKVGDVSTLVMKELPEKDRRVTRIHDRGNFLNPTTEVQAAVPAAFHALPAGAARNRLGFAQWLVSKDNPLTARVAVNRFWARLFGKGIVETEEDFGTQGASPSHPEVLDWLAVEYMRLNWDTKALLKTIVMSETYRQSSNVTPALLEKDPNNRLLARGARFRLDYEVVRDQALEASGLLSRKMFGPPVMPWQPDGIWQVVYNGERWITSGGEDRYRRGLYTFMRRTSPYPSSMTYDAPNGEVCAVRRIRTNTPLQALTSLNDPVFVEASQRLALRTLKEGGKKDKERAAFLFQQAMVRPPTAAEVSRIVKLHQETRDELRRNTAAAQKLLHYDRNLYVEDREVALVADARKGGTEWRYTTEDPGTEWLTPQFNDAAWKTGKALFGFFEAEKDRKEVVTPWETEVLWMRREFEKPAGEMGNLRVQVKTASGFEMYLNGVPAASALIERSGYYEYVLTPQAHKALQNGKNVLAVKVTRLHGKGTRQSMDVGLLGTKAVEYGAPPKDLAEQAAWVAVANAVLNLDETVTRR